VKRHRIACTLALFAISLHLTFNHRFGYYRDELYFIDCAHHLAWGFVDQPPLVPLLVWMTAPVDYALWAMRLVPAILSGVTVLLGCAIARELQGGLFSEALTGIALTLAPAYLLLGYGLSTEFLSPAAWSAVLFLTIRLVNTKNERLLIAIALVVALAMYAKYSIAACAAALALALVITGHGRLLLSKWLVLGIVLVTVTLLPNALWQWDHGLPMLGVIHGDQVNRHALANGAILESSNPAANTLYFAATQLVYQNPLLSIIWIWGLVAFAWGARNAKYRFLAIAYGLLVSLIVATVGRGYYLTGFYPTLLAGGAVAIEDVLRRKPRWAQPVLLGFAIVVAAVMVPFALPVFSLPTYTRYEIAIGLSRRAPADDKYHLVNPVYADQLGWEDMTKMVAQVYHSLPPAQRAGTAIFADRYAYAGAIDFYGPRYGLPPVISPNNSYYLWGTRGYSGNSVIAVGATDYRLLLHAFGTVRQIAVYRNEYRWILEGPLPIYLCTHPNAPLVKLWPSFKYYGL